MPPDADLHYSAAMTIDVIIEAENWQGLGLEGLAGPAFEACLSALDLEPDAWEAVLLACDDTRIAALNADFRDKPTPTNVLSWPSQERAAAAPGQRPASPAGPDPELGDIALAWETCQREARELGIAFEDHVTHLVVHGILHLLGYDHVDEADAHLMENLETEILGNLGIADPY